MSFIVILLVKIFIVGKFIGLFVVFVVVKYVDFFDLIVINLMFGFNCFRYIVMLVVRLLLLIVINKVLMLGFCLSNFLVIVFCFVIIFGLLKGGISV